MTDIQEQHRSGIRFENVIVREARFVDNPSVENEPLGQLALDIELATHIAPDGSRCVVKLVLHVRPQGKEFQTLMASLEGQFSIESDNPSVGLDEFARRQAPALLMPFVREELASLTAKSRFGQILLPPINVVALVEEMESARQESHEPGAKS